MPTEPDHNVSSCNVADKDQVVMGLACGEGDIRIVMSVAGWIEMWQADCLVEFSCDGAEDIAAMLLVAVAAHRRGSVAKEKKSK